MTDAADVYKALAADTTTRLQVRSDDRSHYVIPSWGFVEEIELRPRLVLPNTDAAACYTLVVDLYAPNGARIPLDVSLVARDVKS